MDGSDTGDSDDDDDDDDDGSSAGLGSESDTGTLDRSDSFRRPMVVQPSTHAASGSRRRQLPGTLSPLSRDS